MKTLTFVLFLSFSAALVLLEAAIHVDPNGWGPGKPGECVTLQKQEVRFDIGWCWVVGNSLYKLERGGGCVVKVVDLPFHVIGLDHIGWGSDEFLIFWSDQAAYRCRVSGDSLEQINAFGLLSGFLIHPIVRASVTEGHFGCYYRDVDEIDHDVVQVTIPSLLHEVGSAGERSEVTRQINGIDLEELTWALRSVNIDPWRAPSIDAFEIDEADLRAYAERVAADIEEGDDDEWDFPDFPTPTPDNRDIFTDLPALIDTLSPDAIRAALIEHRNRYTSSSSSSYDVTLVNTEGDTLHCSFTSNGPTQPFCLPWTIRYGDEEFQSYSVELARLLMKLLPEKEYRTEREQKVDMLYVIAEYLGEVRSRRE